MHEEPQESEQAENASTLESTSTDAIHEIADATSEQIGSLDVQFKEVDIEISFEILGDENDEELTEEQRTYLKDDLLCRVTLEIESTGESMVFIIPGNELGGGNTPDTFEQLFPLEGTNVPMDSWMQLAHRPGNSYGGNVTWQLPINEFGRVEPPAELAPYLDGLITAGGEVESGYYNPLEESED